MSDEMKREDHKPAMDEKNERTEGADRPRKPYARPQGDFRGDRRPAGRPYGAARGNGDRKFGDKPGFGGDRKPYHGDRKPFGGDKPAFNGEKKPFCGDRKPMNGDKPAFGGERKPYQGDRKPFGGDKHFADGEKRPFRGDRRPMNDDKPAFGGKYKPYQGDRKPFSGDKPALAGEKRPFRGERKPMDGEKPAFRSAGRPDGAPRKPFGAGARPAVPAPRHGQTDGLPARRLALEIIRLVTENDAYASLALDEKLHACTLSHEDRRLVARLVYDTLENLLYLDHALSQVMAKPDTDIKLRNVMRLGACQILLEDRIPESAATNTSVNLCKELGMEGLGGVCNGILRNLIRQKDELQWPNEDEEPVRALSIRHSVPEWLVERLLADWGHDAAVALMSRHHENNYITVRPNMMQLNDAAFEDLLNQKVWQHERGPVAHSWRIRGMAEIAHDAGFVGGKFSIQGESSMMACMAVAPKRGWTILDACAAPGGKSCLLAEMMEGTGRVQAWDLHPHRVDLIEAQVSRLGLENVRPIVRDACKLREDMIGTVDAVLLDAPCSGTGDMLDKPDVKYRAKPESLAEIIETQHKLLDTVCQYVKKGGVLVYSTCSVLKDENERQVTAFLERHPEFTLEELPESIPEQFRQYQDVGLQLMPSRDDVGGFYIARMRRKRV